LRKNEKHKSPFNDKGRMCMEIKINGYVGFYNQDKKKGKKQ